MAKRLKVESEFQNVRDADLVLKLLAGLVRQRIHMNATKYPRCGDTPDNILNLS
jgi:hypothetical protein